MLLLLLHRFLSDTGLLLLALFLDLSQNCDVSLMQKATLALAEINLEDLMAKAAWRHQRVIDVFFREDGSNRTWLVTVLYRRILPFAYQEQRPFA